MRAPTAIELTCADPDAPCKLPEQLPRRPAAREGRLAHARGRRARRLGPASSWSAAAFATELRDDIQFVAASQGAINAGYFRNVGTTRRLGVELAGSTSLGALSLAARYAYVQATYRSSFTSSSPANTSAGDDGAIEVRSGDRIPGIPASVGQAPRRVRVRRAQPRRAFDPRRVVHAMRAATRTMRIRADASRAMSSPRSTSTSRSRRA
jgi:hypothetical protein